MSKYYIYDTAHAPVELTDKYPYAPQYSTITLFVEGAKNPSSIVDLASMDLTSEQLDVMVDSLLAPFPPATNAEVQISKEQARYLHLTRFNVDSVGD